MYRSASWSRVTEDYSVPWSAPKGLWKGLDEDEPTTYDPTSQEVTKKEKSRAKFAENAVHIIPFVLLACALVLWFFSNPNVDVGVKEESIAARIKGLTIEGDIDNDSDGTQTGFLGTAAEVGGSYKSKLKRDVNKRHRRIQTSRKVVKGFY
ncbi:Uncharacterized protein Rs2_12357 [Raphanus sativus]|uniref:Uncharacterized protein LOC108846474 n=1 Tax=Raphanus sativus TaxID=3726 RepID=A0A6J0MSS3_RAPSA|nr:uncharacterized protein LOC108846474 [Raphanus sativus]KAJ4908699.1 Uncharacterized protein Rs2_12357 [Raphanus sativus]